MTYLFAIGLLAAALVLYSLLTLVMFIGPNPDFPTDDSGIRAATVRRIHSPGCLVPKTDTAQHYALRWGIDKCVDGCKVKEMKRKRRAL